MLSRLSIRSKLLLTFGLICLPFLVIMSIGTHRQWQQRRDLIFDSHHGVAATAAAALQEFFNNFADTQKAIGLAALDSGRPPELFSQYITRVVRANAYLVGCAVITEDGTVLNSEPAASWWQQLGDYSDLQAVRAGDSCRASGLQRTRDGLSVITLTTPLPGTTWYLRSAINVEGLNRTLKLTVRAGWRVVITDHKGRLVYHSLDPHCSWTQRDWSNDVGIQEAMRNGQSRREGYRSRVDGEWCLASYRRVDPDGWVVGSACPAAWAMAPVREALLQEYAQMALAVAGSLLLILGLGRYLSHPIERLALAARNLEQGERIPFVPQEGQDELAVLARTFNRMAHAVQERYDREHTIARTLQTAFLPQHLPECSGYNFAMKYLPALREAEVGGDFYDVFPLAGGKVGLVLGDVSGKGLAAAVHATMTRYLLRAYAIEDPAPASVLGRVNRALCKALEEPGLFVTAIYGVLDPASGVLSYANAGHWPAVVIRAAGTELMGGNGLALGVMSETDYPEGQVQLAPDDGLLLFTDGLVEVGREDPMASLEALQRLLPQWRHRPSQLVEFLHQDALHRGQGRLHDDIALLTLHRSPHAPVPRPRQSQEDNTNAAHSPMPAKQLD